MKINSAKLELAKSETVAEIPMACANELAAIDHALKVKRPAKGWPK